MISAIRVPALDLTKADWTNKSLSGAVLKLKWNEQFIKKNIELHVSPVN